MEPLAMRRERDWMACTTLSLGMETLTQRPWGQEKAMLLTFHG